MPVDDIIRLLEADMRLALFDASTGEFITREQLRGRHTMSYEILLAEETAIKLLRKHIPKKLIEIPRPGFDISESSYVGCPSCLHKINIARFYSYCPHCGQRFKYPPDGESVG